jgi:hypothetical protein
MRPSLPVSVRVVPRSAVDKASWRRVPLYGADHRVYGELPKLSRSTPTLMETLLSRRKDAGDAYPPNVRLEPSLPRGKLGHLPQNQRDAYRKAIPEK